MPDRDDELSRQLRDYYEQLGRRPAPDLTERVMLAADRRAARLRRWGAAGGGLLGAAAVAAVVVVALVNHGSRPPAVGPGPGRSGTPTPSVSTSPVPATATPAPVGPPGGPVPAGFTAWSVTFVSPDDGWVLGTAPCSHAPCTSVVRTRDGGRTWVGIPAPRVALGVQAPGIIRFADAADGWVAIGTHLEATHDGGASWHAVTIPGVSDGLVSDLETSGTIVDAWVVAGNGSGPAALYHAPVSSDAWTSVAGVASSGSFGTISLAGTHGWLVTGQSSYSTSDGSSWVSRPSPCPSQNDVGVAVASATTVYAACTSNGSAGGSMVTRTMLVSSDGGATFHPTAAPPPQTGDFQGITATPDGRTVALSVSTPGAASIQLSSDGGAGYTTPYVASGTAGAPIDDLGFTTTTQGVAVLAPAEVGTLLITRDGGASWQPVRF